MLLNIPNTNIIATPVQYIFFNVLQTYHKLLFLCHDRNIWKGEKASSYVSSRYCFHRNRVNRIFKVFLCCIAPAIVSKFGSQIKALSYTERKDVYLGHLSFQFSLSCSIHANLIHANLIHLVLCRLFMNSISLKELRNAALWFISGFFCL